MIRIGIRKRERMEGILTGKIRTSTKIFLLRKVRHNRLRWYRIIMIV